MIALTWNFPYYGLKDIGGGFWPKLLGGLLIVCAVLLAADTFFRKDSGELKLDFRSEGMKRVLKMCAAVLIFCFLMKIFGFFVATAFIVPAGAYLLGERDKKKLLLITAGVLLFIFLVFEKVLNTGLPGGILF